jgi:hypothetical protein
MAGRAPKCGKAVRFQMRAVHSVLALSLALCIAACGPGGSADPAGSATPTNASGCRTELDYVYDVTNIRLVANYAEFIFVGRAEKELGSGTGPNYTDFSVSVDQSMKGQIGGPVNIRQNGTRSCPVGGDTMLSIGNAYIFAVNQGQDTKPLVMAYPLTDKEFAAAKYPAQYSGALARMADAIANPETLQGPRNPRNP